MCIMIHDLSKLFIDGIEKSAAASGVGGATTGAATSKNRVKGSMGGAVPNKYFLVQNSDTLCVRHILVYSASRASASSRTGVDQNTGMSRSSSGPSLVRRRSSDTGQRFNTVIISSASTLLSYIDSACPTLTSSRVPPPPSVYPISNSFNLKNKIFQNYHKYNIYICCIFLIFNL